MMAILGLGVPNVPSVLTVRISQSVRGSSDYDCLWPKVILSGIASEVGKGLRTCRMA